jgi:hypothetical protein
MLELSECTILSKWYKLSTFRRSGNNISCYLTGLPIPNSDSLLNFHTNSPTLVSHYFGPEFIDSWFV